ncbi:MAG: hypothetical protein ONA90_06980 [candidate division KSB1 bacterium]|nr:hypothetical protein [candidate division KSB1 bacterium]
MEKFVSLLLAIVAFGACRQQSPSPASAYGLRKITDTDSQLVERIRQSGMEILVQQPDYLIVRVDSSAVGTLQSLAITTRPAAERDLIQRLVRIPFNDKAALQVIADLGVDIWHVEGNIVVARVYDLHLEKLHQRGFTYEVVKIDASAPDSTQKNVDHQENQ